MGRTALSISENIFYMTDCLQQIAIILLKEWDQSSYHANRDLEKEGRKVLSVAINRISNEEPIICGRTVKIEGLRSLGGKKDNFDEAEIIQNKNIFILQKFLRAKAGSGIRVALPAFTDGK